MTQKKAPAVTVKAAASIADRLEYEIVSDKKINLTKERAFAFLEYATFQGERPVLERHVQKLYNAWASGRFMWEHVIIGVCQLDDKPYRVNGQHTCWMRVNLPDKEMECVVREVLYKVKDEAALRGVYATFDQNKARTPGHIMKSLLVGTPVAQDVWPSIIGAMTAGLKLWLYEKDNSSLGSEDIVEIINFKHADLFKQVSMFTQNAVNDTAFMKRSGVVAAMFATFHAAPTKGVEFWTPVADGIGLMDKSDARWQLRKFLETHSHSRQQGTLIVSSEDTYRIAVQAWNRWRKGEQVTTLRSTEKRVKAV